MFKRFAKIISILLIVGMSRNGLAAVFGTVAYFTDSAEVAGITITAGTLAFTAVETDLPNNNILYPGEVLPAINGAPAIDAYRRIDVEQSGTMDFNYSVSITGATPSSATSTICHALTISDGTITVNLDGNYKSDPILCGATSTLNLTFHLISSNSELVDQTCDFDYTVKAWQTNLAEDAGGFMGAQTIHSSVTADPWIVGEEEKAEEQVLSVPMEEKIDGGDTGDELDPMEKEAEEKTDDGSVGEEEKSEPEPAAEPEKEEVEDLVVDEGAVLVPDPVDEVSEPATDAGGDGGGDQGGDSEGVEDGDAGSEGGQTAGE
jgi:predicted ribosomally synthesized peptide with SipW-like signal peptide